MSHDGKWTHVLCDECWSLLNPGRQPTLLVEDEAEICCRCGNKTSDRPIRVRGAWEDYHPGEWRTDL